MFILPGNALLGHFQHNFLHSVDPDASLPPRSSFRAVIARFPIIGTMMASSVDIRAADSIRHNILAIYYPNVRQAIIYCESPEN
jgi:hypothetical protein